MDESGHSGNIVELRRRIDEIAAQTNTADCMQSSAPMLAMLAVWLVICLIGWVVLTVIARA